MSNSPLRLRPTVIGGDTLKNDYVVIHDGRIVGRILQASERTGHRPGWDWVINPPLPIPPWGHGSADSLDMAKTAFREAWARFYAALTPEAIAHWHHHDDAAERRSRRT
jgi:hypothetical protein